MTARYVVLLVALCLAAACVAGVAGVGVRLPLGGKCPPGHVWSDGRCHEKGKGHDPKHHDDKRKGQDATLAL